MATHGSGVPDTAGEAAGGIGAASCATTCMDCLICGYHHKIRAGCLEAVNAWAREHMNTQYPREFSYEYWYERTAMRNPEVQPLI